jgi:hypothetical protein
MATANGQVGQGVPDEDQGPVILGATLTVTAAALITMLTRLYVRIRMIRNVGWDDYVMITATILVRRGHTQQQESLSNSIAVYCRSDHHHS